MIDLMAQRPRLDTTAFYFKDSYEAEIQCMNTLTELIKEVSSYLMSNEKRLNKSIKDYLQLTYKVLNEYTNKKWTDVKPEELSKEVKQRQTVQGGLRY
jgi:UDP-galactopyranose mutase